MKSDNALKDRLFNEVQTMFLFDLDNIEPHWKIRASRMDKIVEKVKKQAGCPELAVQAKIQKLLDGAEAIRSDLALLFQRAGSGDLSQELLAASEAIRKEPVSISALTNISERCKDAGALRPYLRSVAAMYAADLKCFIHAWQLYRAMEKDE